MGVRDVAIVYFDGVLKLLGLLHCAFGGLLIVMGIVVRVAVDHWTSIMLLAIWIGIFVAATGVIAVVDSNLEKPERSRKYYLSDFLLFSVLCLLLSVMLIVCYSMAVYTAFSGDQLGSFVWYSYERYYTQNMLRVKLLTVIVLILSLLEFLLAIGSIGYVAHAHKRDQRRKPFQGDAPHSYDNQIYNSSQL